MVADCSVLCYCISSNGDVFILIGSGPIPPVRTHRSLETPTVDETSVSGYVYHLLLGHEGGRRGHQVSAPQALHRPGRARPPPTPGGTAPSITPYNQQAVLGRAETAPLHLYSWMLMSKRGLSLRPLSLIQGPTGTVLNHLARRGSGAPELHKLQQLKEESRELSSSDEERSRALKGSADRERLMIASIRYIYLTYDLI
ncbi:unnamed protein product [Boreogadus saida]